MHGAVGPEYGAVEGAARRGRMREKEEERRGGEERREEEEKREEKRRGEEEERAGVRSHGEGGVLIQREGSRREGR